MALRRLLGRSTPKIRPPRPDLRQLALDLDPQAMKMTSNAHLSHVFGVLVDTGFPDGWASVLSLADGTTSLYTSGGGGVIGGGGHERVAKATVHLLSLIEADLHLFADTEDLELPGPGKVRFLVLTYDGKRAAERGIDVLAAGGDRLSPIFSAANDVMTELRIATPDTQPPASTTDR